LSGRHRIYCLTKWQQSDFAKNPNNLQSLDRELGYPPLANANLTCLRLAQTGNTARLAEDRKSQLIGTTEKLVIHDNARIDLRVM